MRPALSLRVAGEALLIGLLAVGLHAGPAGAAGSVQQDQSGQLIESKRDLVPISLTQEQETRARKLEDQFKCPVCRSQSIRQSRSFMAEDMKRRIRELVAEGRSDTEIKAHFTDRYGEWILLTPTRSGFNLTAWLLPFFVVLIGGFSLFVLARRWSRQEAPVSPPEPPPSSPHLAQLEHELKENE
jgi:cytochrome c-type biogenesis protein CcmH